MVDDDIRRPAGEARLSIRRELLERTVHDLKNPLAVVRATLEWLEVELADRAEALDAVHDATSAAGRLVGIVEDLDTLAHLDMGRAVAKGPVDVEAILRAVTQSAGARLASRNITVVSVARSGIATNGDEPLLARSIEALVDVCARGATAGACVEIDARLVQTREPERDGEMVEIAVGLRGMSGTAPPVASLDVLSMGGLGAYLAVRVVERHGGSVVVVPTASVPRVLARLPR